MEFASADPSAVRSIRQRVLLHSWMRALRGEKLFPMIGDFQPDGVANELTDMMAFDVEGDGQTARFLITQEGSRLTATYDRENVDPAALRTRHYLDDVLAPERYARILSCYLTCLARKRPVYSISRLFDADDKPVSYERLLLPFGRGNRVEQIIGSYKAIRIAGGAQVTNLTGISTTLSPVQVVSAVIDGPSTNRAINRSAEDTIVPGKGLPPHFPGLTSFA